MARMRYPLPVTAAVVCGSFWLAFGERADQAAPDDTGPGIEVVDVFTPQSEQAYANVRIPALAVSKEGTLLAFAEGVPGRMLGWFSGQGGIHSLPRDLILPVELI